MIGDAGEHVGEPGARVDITELCRLDQREDHGGTLAAGVGAAEGPVAAADGDAAHGALGGVVGHADAAVVEEARERAPALETVVHRLGQRALRGQLAPLGPEPALEILGERLGPLAPDTYPLLRRQTVDLALDREQ